MHHYFSKRSILRQWLNCVDLSPMLRFVLELLDKAYNIGQGQKYSTEDSILNTELEAVMSLSASNSQPPPELTRLVGQDVECFSRIPGAKGHYTIPKKVGLGNSYICYKSRSRDSDGRWSAGQIQYIFRATGGGTIQLAIKRSMENISPDPFSSFWEDGFEAKLVSSQFQPGLEIVPLSDVIAHTARWSVSESLDVVLSLSDVCLSTPSFILHLFLKITYTGLNQVLVLALTSTFDEMYDA